ncbi:MAG: hypothetical protein H0V34_03345 [Gammaproteobacteria bacterium]|nr:hypothetical protein [Gammaproteobacteria bacterium]
MTRRLDWQLKTHNTIVRVEADSNFAAFNLMVYSGSAAMGGGLEGG